MGPEGQVEVMPMRLSDTAGPLRDAGELLLRVTRSLDGHGPEELDWGYKCTHNSGSGYAWIRLIGDRARKYHGGH